MKNLLYILLFIPLLINAQNKYSIEMNDVKYKSSQIGGVSFNIPTSTTEEEDEENFIYYNTWDFEEMTLGEFDSDSIDKYWNPVRVESSSNGTITQDTINGLATQVMQIANYEAYNGFKVHLPITEPRTDFDEIYLTYNWRFSSEHKGTNSSKLPGLLGYPDDLTGDADNCPNPGEGFTCGFLWKYWGEFISYHYDHTGAACKASIGGYPSGTSCPWSLGWDGAENDFIFTMGTWYAITTRVVLNSFTGGVANSDGIKETWIDGRMIFQEPCLIFADTENDTLGVDVFRLGHFHNNPTTPMTYGYVDNAVAWMPSNDSVTGYDLHNTSSILPTPSELIDEEFYYDSLVTSAGSLQNTSYSGYSSGDETFLIDAGEGNTVSYNFSLDIQDRAGIFIYDGNTTDADLLYNIHDVNTDSDVITSTGRYMFIRLGVGSGGSSVTGGFTGTITFN